MIHYYGTINKLINRINFSLVNIYIFLRQNSTQVLLQLLYLWSVHNSAASVGLETSLFHIFYVMLSQNFGYRNVSKASLTCFKFLELYYEYQDLTELWANLHFENCLPKHQTNYVFLIFLQFAICNFFNFYHILKKIQN